MFHGDWGRSGFWVGETGGPSFSSYPLQNHNEPCLFVIFFFSTLFISIEDRYLLRHAVQNTTMYNMTDT